MATGSAHVLVTHYTNPYEEKDSVARPRTRAETQLEPTGKSSVAQSILRRLFSQGSAVIGSSGIDEAWTGAVAGVLVRAIAEGDLDSLVTARDGLRRLAAAARMAGATDSARVDDDARRKGAAVDASSEATGLKPSTRSFHRIEPLLEIVDAAASLLRPQVLVAGPEWGTLQAQILLALTRDRATPNEEVRETVRGGPTQLSRAFKYLVDQGLVQRRSYGRKVAWTLTAAGQEAAMAVRHLESAASSVRQKQAAQLRTDDVLEERRLVHSPEALRAAISSASGNVWIDASQLMNEEEADSSRKAIVYHRVDEAVTLDTDNWDDHDWAEKWRDKWLRASTVPTLLFASGPDVYYIGIIQRASELTGSLAKGDVSTYNEDGVWKSKVEGSRRAAHVGGTKAQQSAVGRKMAQERKVEHVVKKLDGTIGEKNSYGNDSNAPKG